ncbi:MAG: type II toxin-antitoxin system HicB family antitoxin [Planctomycetota bacterium]|nr:MAG: type II toxin-antitoxin system HicB family antitoxin [Planctomycetota bacterium]RLS93790.1 MAG: type II toxin-antitoxin system HicB family antitoxin [Planctomycetota bacterium]
MNYPVVIHKDRKSDYGVCVPDLPGCVSAGSTVDEALAMIREAIELHLEGMIEEGGVIPLASTIEVLRADADYADGTWAFVHVDESNLRVRIARVGITMPQRVLDAIDRHAKSSGETRSGLLARAAVRYIGREAGTMPEAKRGGSKLRIMRNNLKKAAKRKGR